MMNKSGKTGITVTEFGCKDKDIYRFKTSLRIYWKFRVDRREEFEAVSHVFKTIIRKR